MTAKDTVRSLGVPAIIGMGLVLPFLVLQATSRRGFQEGFPLALFVVLWFLSAVFTLVGMPIVRGVLAGERILAHPVRLSLQVAFLILVAWVWGAIVLDQLPCFLGVPNCD